MKQDETLTQAIRTVLRGFDEGVFVRSTDGDTDPAWAIRLFPFIQALGVLQESVRGDGWIYGEDCPVHSGPNPEVQP
jgi:hypothetical protein